MPIKTTIEYVVTCRYCNYRVCTPDEAFALGKEREHLTQCNVIQAAEAHKGQDAMTAFLEGFIFSRDHFRK